MKRYDKLLFVDKEDTALAPMAEAIMQRKLLLEDILIESRGLVVLFPEPVNPRVEEVLNNRGLQLEEHTSRLLEASEFDERTLILTMNQSQKEKILNEYEQPLNVLTLREYVGADDDAPDPYGGTVEDYEECFDRLWSMTDRLADILRQEG